MGVGRRRVRITRTIQAKAPIEEVFRIISNPENIFKLKLMPDDDDDEYDSPIKVHSIERITKDPVGKGSIWHFKGSFFNRIPVEYDEQVTVWDPPRRLVTEQIGGGPFKAIRWEHKLVPARSGSVTKETWTVEYDPPNSLRMLVDGKTLLDKSMEIALDRLKQFLEERKKKQGGHTSLGGPSSH